jgi:predicted transcriptional regulator
MPLSKLTKIEMKVMDALWTRGALAIREIQETFPEDARPPYTTIQAVVYRLEARDAVRRVKKISNAHIFEAVVSRAAAHRGLIEGLMDLFDGRTRPVMAHLVESGRLTIKDVKEVEKTLKGLRKKKGARKP